MAGIALALPCSGMAEKSLNKSFVQVLTPIAHMRYCPLAMRKYSSNFSPCFVASARNEQPHCTQGTGDLITYENPPFVF
jgi:hypothetical protein